MTLQASIPAQIVSDKSADKQSDKDCAGVLSSHNPGVTEHGLPEQPWHGKDSPCLAQAPSRAESVRRVDMQGRGGRWVAKCQGCSACSSHGHVSSLDAAKIFDRAAI